MQDLKAALSDRDLQKKIKKNFVGVWEKHITCTMSVFRKRAIGGAHVRIMDSNRKTILHYDYGFGTMVSGGLQKKYWEGRVRKIKALVKKALRQTRKWY